MKTVAEQILSKCIHFTGVQNKVCEAGIVYQDVIDANDKPYKFPCLNEGNTQCCKREFPTKEEAERKAKEIDDSCAAVVTAIVQIKAKVKGGEKQGQIDCKCGGKINYATAECNGHIRAKCTKCDIQFME